MIATTQNSPKNFDRPSVVAFATKGSGTNEERRLRRLLGGHKADFLAFDKSAKFSSLCGLWSAVWREQPELLVMEGTGIAGGGVCILTRVLRGQRYIVSSGDAVGPFVGGIKPWLGPVFGLYERALCRLAAGFIGWTPYLTGRALTFGVPRAMTAAGWSEQQVPTPNARRLVRERLGIPANAVVFGLVGSLVWNKRYKYCYGMELIQAAGQIDRPDLRVMIVGDGTGLAALRDAAGDRLGHSIFLPGAVPAEQTIDYMAAMDVGSLPQSVDGVGSFRYTTKISEYLAAGLPIVTGQTPLAYDLNDGWAWRLPGPSPWSSQYLTALGRLMQTLSPEDIAAAGRQVKPRLDVFNVDRQTRAVTAFVSDLLNQGRPTKPPVEPRAKSAAPTVPAPTP